MNDSGPERNDPSSEERDQVISEAQAETEAMMTIIKCLAARDPEAQERILRATAVLYGVDVR